MVSTSKVRLSDVAAAAKVSVPTVSMALANHPNISARTRRRVLALSRRLGYRSRTLEGKAGEVPSSAIRRLGSVVLGDSFDRPVIALCFARLTASATRMHARLDAACIENIDDDAAVTEKLSRLAQPVDGILLLGVVRPAAVEALAAAHVPCVALGDQPAEQRQPGLDVVTFDHMRAGNVASGHLLRRGHRRIAFLTDTLSPGGANLRWLDGYRVAHLDAGLPIDPQLIAVTNVIDSGTGPAVDALLHLEAPPTAWVVVNDFLAAELLIRLKELGRRDEVCIYAERPPQAEGLSAILYSVKTLCEAAMNRLVQLCKHPGEPPLRIVVPFETYNIENP